MKKIALSSLACVLLTGCLATTSELTAPEVAQKAETLSAEDTKKAQQDDRGHRPMPMSEKRFANLLKEYNANDDQKVTWAEYNDWRRQRFDHTDANKDGIIDAEEYVYEFENRLDERYEQGRKAHQVQTDRRFTALDKDANALIEWSEYAASGDRIFSAWDKNEDGVINDADPMDEKRKGRRRDFDNNNPISFIRMPTTHTFKGLLSIYDANEDGAVSADEFNAERRSVFYLADADRSGALSSEEYWNEYEDRLDQTVNASRRGQIKQTYVRFSILDDNSDKQMTFDEMQISGKRIFTRWDKNNDGIISSLDVGQ